MFGKLGAFLSNATSRVHVCAAALTACNEMHGNKNVARVLVETHCGTTRQHFSTSVCRKLCTLEFCVVLLVCVCDWQWSWVESTKKESVHCGALLISRDHIAGSLMEPVPGEGFYPLFGFKHFCEMNIAPSTPISTWFLLFFGGLCSCALCQRAAGERWSVWTQWTTGQVCG